MNTPTIRVLALFSLIAILNPFGAIAQGPAPVYATIPFGFTAGQKSFDAGGYSVAELVPNVLRIRSDDGRVDMVVMAQTDESGRIPGQVMLSFHRYGDQYFLSSVSNGDRGWALPKSPGEKELIAERVSHGYVAVIASSRR